MKSAERKMKLFKNNLQMVGNKSAKICWSELLKIAHYGAPVLHNGGFSNGCITKRILLLQAFHS